MFAWGLWLGFGLGVAATIIAVIVAAWLHRKVID
jgi:hypothetical protein